MTASCTVLQEGAVLHLPEGSTEDASTEARTAQSMKLMGAVTAPVRDACPACTTGLAVTMQGGVCATFAAGQSQRVYRDDISCWVLRYLPPISGERSSPDDTWQPLHQDGAWRLERVPGAPFQAGDIEHGHCCKVLYCMPRTVDLECLRAPWLVPRH